VIKAAVINSAFESKLDPLADSKKYVTEDSVGLFQLNINGAGAGMSQKERENPILNTRRISDEFHAKLSETAPIGGSAASRLEAARVALGLPTLGEMVARANAGERPSVGEWTAAWTIQVERPGKTLADATSRKKAADELFPPGTQQASQITTQRTPSRLVIIAMDPKEMQAFSARLGTQPRLLEEMSAILDIENQAKALVESGGGATPAFGELLAAASRRWAALGVAAGDPWPISRAAALADMASNARLRDDALRLLERNHPSTELGTVARAELQRFARRGREEQAVAPGAWMRETVSQIPTPLLVASAAVGAAMFGALVLSAVRLR
jgi:hypothetical protein